MKSSTTKFPNIQALAVDVVFLKNSFKVRLADDREISVPIDWSSRLHKATLKQRRNWRIIGGGIGIHWTDLDEDILVESLLRLS